MGLAVIPDDWTGNYVELCVRWPDSADWLAILRGQLTEPYEVEFWDKFTGTPTDAQTAIEETFDNNLHLEECMIIPTGMIAVLAGGSVPTGWTVCDGAAISRTAYADLFAKLGVMYGSGDGSTTFNLPNLKGKIPVGYDASQTEFDALGEQGGSKTHTLTTAQIPSHDHVQNSLTVYNVAGGNLLAGGANSTFGGARNTATTGGGGSHNNLQPYVTMQYIIKL